jgi:CO/xanthine dehydrogenase Mo-binding subunit
MYYVLQGYVVWSAHRTADKATAAARRAFRKWARIGLHYDARVAKIAGRWQRGDNPASRYWQENVSVYSGL